MSGPLRRRAAPKLVSDDEAAALSAAGRRYRVLAAARRPSAVVAPPALDGGAPVLPHDALVHALLFLNTGELLHCAAVARDWHGAAACDALWQALWRATAWCRHYEESGRPTHHAGALAPGARARAGAALAAPSTWRELYTAVAPCWERSRVRVHDEALRAKALWEPQLAAGRARVRHFVACSRIAIALAALAGLLAWDRAAPRGAHAADGRDDGGLERAIAGARERDRHIFYSTLVLMVALAVCGALVPWWAALRERREVAACIRPHLSREANARFPSDRALVDLLSGAGGGPTRDDILFPNRPAPLVRQRGVRNLRVDADEDEDEDDGAAPSRTQRRAPAGWD